MMKKRRTPSVTAAGIHPIKISTVVAALFTAVLLLLCGQYCCIIIYEAPQVSR